MNNGKICVSVCAATADEMIAKIKLAEKRADLIEVRFDCLQPTELFTRHSSIVAATTKPLISTLRVREQGGRRPISPEDRMNFWSSGCETDYCDMEEDIIDSSWYWLWGEQICSYHDLDGMPADMPAVFERLSSAGSEEIGCGAPTIKIAARAGDICDTIPIWKLIPQALSASKKVIPIAMGEAGKWTRILGLAHGAFLTYGSLDAGNETADGQLTAKDLIEIYRVKELTPKTKVFGVIGDPVSGSLSPYIHNPAFRAAGLNNVFLHLQVKDLDAFIRRMVAPETREVELNFAGFAVTMPHKQAIMRHLDEIDPAAERIGAVNTVKVVESKLKGFNTDAGGFIKPLKKMLGDLKGARTVVAGAGGAARAVVFALKEAGADVTVLARNASKAAKLAHDFGANHGDLHGASLGNVDILVNATPLGMRGPNVDKKLFAAERLSGVKFICDLVTSVTDTPLLREAQNARIPAIGGIEMLLAQAEMQFEIWTGSRPKVGIMRQSLLERMRS